jgi:hypothetical protein
MVQRKLSEETKRRLDELDRPASSITRLVRLKDSTAGVLDRVGAYGAGYTAPENLEDCRIVGFRGSGPSRSVSSRWASRPLKGSPVESRYAACTNACSAYWRWKASRSNRGSRRRTVRG